MKINLGYALSTKGNTVTIERNTDDDEVSVSLWQDGDQIWLGAALAREVAEALLDLLDEAEENG